MAGRTSQLQIRVSPEQKATLKRLAAAAGLNVSQYVLSRALPEDGEELHRALEEVRKGVSSAALADLARALSTVAADGWGACLDGWTPAGMSPSAQNRVAALVEWVARSRGLPTPGWTESVTPLPRPSFRWPLASLRPYQLRAVPVAYKRRNVFDPGLPRVQPRGSEPTPALDPLAEHLDSIESEVEFYFVAGSVLWQAFPAERRSARPRALFAPRVDPVGPFLAERGLSRAWLATELQAAGAWLDRPRVAAFRPPAGYALAVKLACLPSSPTPSDLDDLRLLLGSVGATSWETAVAAVSHYVAERQLPPHAKETVARLPA